MELSRSLQRAIAAHAAREHPRECCGLIVRGVRQRRYVACRNAAGSPSEHFVIDHQDWCAAEDQGEVLAIVHSHLTFRPRRAWPIGSVANCMVCPG